MLKQQTKVTYAARARILNVYTICLMGQKKLNPPAKSKEVLVVLVLFAFYLTGFTVACMDASSETYFKQQELARKKLIYEIYIIYFQDQG